MTSVARTETFELYPRPPDSEFSRRHALIREAMRREGLGCLVAYGGYQEMYQQNARYLSGYTDLVHFYVVLPLEGEPTLLIHSAPMVRNAHQIAAIDDVRWGGPRIAEAVVSRVRELGCDSVPIGLVGIETLRDISVPVEHWRTFTQSLPDAELRTMTQLVEEIRVEKSGAELRLLQRGAEATDHAMAAGAAAVIPGKREFDVVGALRCAANENGASPSFVYVASTPMAAPSASYPAFGSSSRILRESDILLVETAVSYGGYSGSVGRTITIGEPTPFFKDLYSVALETYRRLSAAVRPGATEADLLEATRPIVEAGLTVQAPTIKGWDNKIERPLIGVINSESIATTACRLRPNQVLAITVNPSTPNLEAAVFLANLHLVTQDGNICLQSYPPDLIVR